MQAYHYYKYSTVKRGRSQSTDGESLETHKRPCYERSLNQYYRERTHDLSSSSWNARVAKRAPSEETWNGPILNDVNQQQNMKPSSKKKSNLELLQDLDKKELQKLLLKGKQIAPYSITLLTNTLL